jgi:hypothetical protein
MAVERMRAQKAKELQKQKLKDKAARLRAEHQTYLKA